MSLLISTLTASGLTVLMLACVFWPLERMWPARRQRWLRDRLGTDFLFLFGQHLVWTVLAVSILRSVDGMVRGAAPEFLRTGFGALPWGLQLLAVVLLGDLAVYWFHRACHAVPFLWRIHSIHHSSETLDWVAAHREHPLDGLLTQLTLNLPAILLGFSLPGLAAVAVFRGLWAAFIHSNVRVPLGPLKYLFGAPELHHWHHAKHPGVVANYGNLAPWTDFLFGTHHDPGPGEETYELGVPEPMPRGWLELIAFPFVHAARERRLAWGVAVLISLAVMTSAGLSWAHGADSGVVDAGAADAGSPPLAAVFTGADYMSASKTFGPSQPFNHSIKLGGAHAEVNLVQLEVTGASSPKRKAQLERKLKERLLQFTTCRGWVDAGLWSVSVMLQLDSEGMPTRVESQPQDASSQCVSEVLKGMRITTGHAESVEISFSDH